jgi:hypothetical protein
MYEDNRDLHRALERLTVQDVWRAAGLPNVPRDGNDIVASPFRDDGSRGSFSIFLKGQAWKDHGGDGDGGRVWQFALKARGGTPKDVADWLIDEVAKITRTPRVRAVVREAVTAATAAGVVAELPKDVLRAAKKVERAAQNYEAEEALWDQREGSLLMTKTEAREVEKWSPEVRAAFAEGWKHLGADESRVKDWADGRGWPTEWVNFLHSEGVISMPWLPWCAAGERWAKRGKALRVEVPRIAADGRSVSMEIVGYHQQFFTVGKQLEDGAWEPGRKQWVYVPYVPDDRDGEKRLAPFQEVLRSLGKSIPALPWAMGDFTSTRFLVIAEGQWDAITFAGAAGWLWEAGWPAGAAVMGVRGMDGVDVMLAYWSKWLRACAPAVLVLADNDRAGRKWFEYRAKEYGQLAAPTLADRLRARGAKRVEVSTVRPELGKDFNDFYRARKPAAADILKWLQSLNFLNAAGEWI